jgi:multidrug efflux pump
VIVLGKQLDAEMARLRASLPAGLKLESVASMPHAVGRSIDDFVEAVAEAIGIVLIVSLISWVCAPAWSS